MLTLETGMERTVNCFIDPKGIVVISGRKENLRNNYVQFSLPNGRTVDAPILSWIKESDVRWMLHISNPIYVEINIFTDSNQRWNIKVHKYHDGRWEESHTIEKLYIGD